MKSCFETFSEQKSFLFRPFLIVAQKTEYRDNWVRFFKNLTLSSPKHVIWLKKYSGIDFVTEYQQIFRDPKYFKSITEYFFEWWNWCFQMLYSVMFVTVYMIQFRGWKALWKKKLISQFVSPLTVRCNKHMSRSYHQKSPKLLNDYDDSTWSKMLQLGRCKVLLTKDGKLFRRLLLSFVRRKETVRERKWFPNADRTGAPSATVDIKILGVLVVLCPFYWEIISLGSDRFSIVMTVINICNILEYSKSFALHGTSKFGASLTFLLWRPDVEHQTPKRWELLCVDLSIDSRYYYEYR